jgi:starch-binding outer membrane protein SusE/F
MKKLIFALSMITSLALLFSCETDFDDPVLDMSQANAPAIVNPDDGDSFILDQGQAGELLTEITWTRARYNIANLANPRYLVQVDVSGNNFANARDLAASVDTVVTITHQQLNTRLMALELEPGVPHQIQFRVLASISDNAVYDNLVSDPVTITVTPFDADAADEVKPIYMLGNGTEAGWNNNAAIEMYHIEDGIFGLVANLGQSGNMVKFISVLGQWAPQWGQESGTAEEGTLAYRPTEDVPDPEPINIGALEPGLYRVVADTANLTYTIIPSTSTLYLLGSATTAGWSNTAALEMDQEDHGIFTITTQLTAGEDMFFKFLEILGQWAPQYGTDEDGTWEKGRLVYRPTEAVPDPPAIPAPDESGLYTITVNLGSRKYTVTPAE